MHPVRPALKNPPTRRLHRETVLTDDETVVPKVAGRLWESICGWEAYCTLTRGSQIQDHFKLIRGTLIVETQYDAWETFIAGGESVMESDGRGGGERSVRALKPVSRGSAAAVPFPACSSDQIGHKK